MVGGRATLLAVLVVALASQCSAQTSSYDVVLPYSKDGKSCIPQKDLDARIDSSPLSQAEKDKAKEDCRLACQRVSEVVISKGEKCAKSVDYVMKLILMMQQPTWNDVEANKMLKFLVHEHGEPSESCFDDLEVHWNRREKFCSIPQTPAKFTTDANTDQIGSSLRRFMVHFMRRHTGHGSDKKFCLKAMWEAQRNQNVAVAFKPTAKGGKCKSLLTERWSKDDCSEECWKQIEGATTAAGGPECCLATYYADMYDFTYRPGFFDRDTSVSIPKDNSPMSASCSASQLPCTFPYDAIKMCDSKWGNKAKYLPTECGHSGASALLASPLLALSASVAAVWALARF